jgi:hypothetical protein
MLAMFAQNPGPSDNGSSAYTTLPSIPHPITSGATAGTNPYTLSGVNTAGSTLVVVHATFYETIAGSVSVVDNCSSTTLTPLGVLQPPAANSADEFFYELRPSSTCSSTSFTMTGGSGAMYGTMWVYPVVGVSGVYDSNLVTATGTSTCQTAAINPGSGAHVVFAGLNQEYTSTGTSTISGGYTLSYVPYNPGVTVGGGAGYLIQSPGASTQPTWTPSAALILGCQLLSFH